MGKLRSRAPEPVPRLPRWAPQPGPQQHAIEAACFPDLFFGGARGGGKSDLLLGDYAADVPTYGRDWRGILFRQSYPALEELIARSQQIIPGCFPGSSWTQKPPGWVLPNGATLKMRQLENEQDADKYQGHQYTWIGWDELPQWASPVPFKKLMATLRNGNRPIPFKRVRSAGNPGGAGHQWVRARYIDPAPAGYTPIDDPETGMTRIFIPSKVADNKLLLINDPAYIQRLRGVGSAELVRAWLDGDWSVVTGAYFDCWSTKDHVIPPFQVPKDWLRFRSMDWGSAKPFSVGWWAVVGEDVEVHDRFVPRGALIRYREWYGASAPNVGLKLTAEEVAAGITRREAGDDIAYGVMDPAAWIQNGGPSIAERMMRAGSDKWRPADNKRVPGWDQVRGRLIGEQDQPMLIVFSTCAHTIRTLPALQHDPDKPEDLDSDGEDHAADEIRYGCMSRPYVRQLEAERRPRFLHEATADEIFWPRNAGRTHERA